jgi:5-methylcytosine-specific restriction protein A
MLFEIGQKYTKKEIYIILNVPVEQQKGNWDTGYNKFNNQIFIFCNIGIAGRSGQNHNSEWLDDKLRWFAKSKSTIQQPLMKDFLSNRFPVFFFTRTDNGFPFTFEGEAQVDQFLDSSPVQIIWKFSRSFYKEISFPEELLQEDAKLYEGASTQVLVNKYERNISARRICLDRYGYDCQICTFNFLKKYGQIGKEFIQVHHIKALSSIGEEYQIDPIKDLVPVCPNCHSVIHIKNPCYTLDEVRAMFVFNESKNC